MGVCCVEIREGAMGQGGIPMMQDRCLTRKKALDGSQS